jgi:hypothetical protein
LLHHRAHLLKLCRVSHLNYSPTPPLPHLSPAAAGRRRLQQAKSAPSIIGPAWHNLAVTPASLQAFAKTGGCYLREVRV